MSMLSRSVMTPEDFRLIKEFVSEIFGLIIEDSKETFLTAKLLPRLEELRLSSFAEYYTYLKFSPHNAEEQRRFISIITNNETYFFREEAQLKVLTEHVIPSLKERKLRTGRRTVRIISAGCSSGEEVYTLGMLLLESGNFVWDWEVEIIGVDIDSQVIARAEEGIYQERSFQATPAAIRERYFKHCDQGWKIKDLLRKNVRFIQGNLLNFEKVVEPRQEIDIIFCRNVLIYFSDDTIRRIIASFSKVLAPEGLLFLGHSESLSRITNIYMPMRFPGAIIYKKRD